MASIGIPKHGLVVSCQALEDEPMHGAHHMAGMARAAKEGGAVGIRANSPVDIASIKREVDLPLIGLWKKDTQGLDVYITPTLEDVIAVHEAGADIVALDATARRRAGKLCINEIVAEARKRGIPIMADISTFEEGLQAAAWGVDYVSTTLCGYTQATQGVRLPNLELIERLAGAISVPVVAEGGIHSPVQAEEALRRGAHFVVIGSAITRPQWITRQYVAAMESALRLEKR